MSSVLMNSSTSMHVEGCQNPLFIFGINKALESDADFLGIPDTVNVSPAMEGWDCPRSGESQFLAFVWSLALQLSASKSPIYVVYAGISLEVEN